MPESFSRREFLASAAAASLAASLPVPASSGRDPAGGGEAAPIVISTWRHGVAANAAAWEVLARGGSALDAVEAGVRVSEADPEVTSVGRGGTPNREGVVELDACIMDGASRAAGSVAALRGILHPVSVARKVMEETRHVMLVGDGARRFALDHGFEEVELMTETGRAAFEKKRAEWAREGREEAGGSEEGAGREGADGGDDDHDTIGMVAIDASGGIAGACTTSGLAWKLPGRVGDSPIIGAGMYADIAAGAAAATGIGEEVIKVCGSFLIVEAMRAGKPPRVACETAVRRILEGHPGNREKQVAFIALGRDGSFGAAAIRKGFQVAIRTRERDDLIDVDPAGG